MNSIFVLAAFTATVALLSGTCTEAQSLVSCKDFVQSMALKQIRLFFGAEETPGISSQLCYEIDETSLTPRFVLLRFFYCPVGFIAVLPKFDTPESMQNMDYTQVTNLTESDTNKTETKEVVLFCAPVPTEPPTPKPTPASIGACPRYVPTRVNQYLRRDQSRICASRCSFGVGYAGTSIGSRTRTIWQCCDGQRAVIVSRASRLYTCP